MILEIDSTTSALWDRTFTPECGILLGDAEHRLGALNCSRTFPADNGQGGGHTRPLNGPPLLRVLCNLILPRTLVSFEGGEVVAP